MEMKSYLEKFQNSVNRLDKVQFDQKQLNIKVGRWFNSIVLKIQKKSWLNPSSTKPFEESVFFCVWINAKSTDENKLFYNIHALKLRQLKNYAIKSRDFATDFREKFKAFEQNWPNVSTNFGPLTLMEGWVETDLNSFENTIAELANKFLEIEFIIDELLEERKKT